jgi:hypothetical protein
MSVARRVAAGVTVREVDLNGQPGLVFEEEGQVTMALTLDVHGDRVVDVRVVTNPDKLVALQPDRRPDLSGLTLRSSLRSRYAARPPDDQPARADTSDDAGPVPTEFIAATV